MNVSGSHDIVERTKYGTITCFAANFIIVVVAVEIPESSKTCSVRRLPTTCQQSK